jgi:hypothetical protein
MHLRTNLVIKLSLFYKRKVRVSVLSKKKKLHRERIEGHEKLMRSYFNENPIFPENYFWRRFRMSIDLFKHIEDDRGKNVDHTHYELMGVPMQVRRSTYRIARFIAERHI